MTDVSSPPLYASMTLGLVDVDIVAVRSGNDIMYTKWNFTGGG